MIALSPFFYYKLFYYLLHVFGMEWEKEIKK